MKDVAALPIKSSVTLGNIHSPEPRTVETIQAEVVSANSC